MFFHTVGRLGELPYRRVASRREGVDDSLLFLAGDPLDTRHLHVGEACGCGVGVHVHDGAGVVGVGVAGVPAGRLGDFVLSNTREHGAGFVGVGAVERAALLSHYVAVVGFDSRGGGVEPELGERVGYVLVAGVYTAVQVSHPLPGEVVPASDVPVMYRVVAVDTDDARLVE